MNFVCEKGFYQSRLRALDSNSREIAVKSENSIFFIFSRKKPFGELFTKITIKLSKEFSFLRWLVSVSSIFKHFSALTLLTGLY